MKLKNNLYILSILGLAHTHAQSLFIGNSQFNLDIVNRNSQVQFDTMSKKPVLENFTFWVSGIVGSDTLCIADNIFSNNTEWVYGPAHSSGNKWMVPWQPFMQVSQMELEFHINNFNKTNYTPIPAIANWPAANSASGFATVLAPFVDVNTDGMYNASNGDYPFVFGVENIVQVLTDSWLKSSLKTKAMPVDITIQYYTIKNQNDVVFMRITACNRSNVAINNFRFSSVLNSKIGNDIDDAMETNVQNNAVHILNGYASDAVYGTQWPAAGFMFLSEKLANSIYFRNENSAVYGAPKTAEQVYNMAHGNWLSGKKLTYGGSGLDGQINANWVYSGTTDTGFNKPEWKDDLMPGKRTVVASTSDFTLAAGECKVLDAAIFIVVNGKNALDRIAADNTIRNVYQAQAHALHINVPAKAIPQKNFFAKPGTLVAQLPAGIYNLINLDGQFLQKGRQELLAPSKPGLYVILEGDKVVGKLWVLD